MYLIYMYLIYNWCSTHRRVGWNRIFTPYVTVYLEVCLPKIPHINRKYSGFLPTLTNWLAYVANPCKWMPGTGCKRL